MAPSPLLSMQKSPFSLFSKILPKPTKYCIFWFFWHLDLLQIGALDAPESYPLVFGALGALLKCFCRAIHSVFIFQMRLSAVQSGSREALGPLLRPLPERSRAFWRSTIASKWLLIASTISFLLFSKILPKPMKYCYVCFFWGHL